MFNPLNSPFQETMESNKSKIKTMIEERMEKITEFTNSSVIRRVGSVAHSCTSVSL